MSGGTMRRGAKLTLGGVVISICIPWLAHGLQNPDAPWLHATPIVDDLVVLSAPAEKAQPGWAIQVGAYGQADAAGGQLTLLAQRQSDLLGSATPIVEPVDLPGGKRLFRARFGTFSRLDAARNQNVSGVGLGLTIARDTARAHGGDVVLGRSDLGGLKATLRLPFGAAPVRDRERD